MRSKVIASYSSWKRAPSQHDRSCDSTSRNPIHHPCQCIVTHCKENVNKIEMSYSLIRASRLPDRERVKMPNFAWFIFSDERGLYVHSYNNVSAFVNKLNQTPSGGIPRNWKQELAALRAYPIFSLWNIITQKKVFVIQKKSIFNNDCIKTHCILHSAAKIISPQEFETEKMSWNKKSSTRDD